MVFNMFNVLTIKDIKVKIGTACKLQRTLHNLSREQLAEELGVSKTTIQNIENGKNSTLDNLLKVANHFGFLESIAKELDQVINRREDISLY